MSTRSIALFTYDNYESTNRRGIGYNFRTSGMQLLKSREIK